MADQMSTAYESVELRGPCPRATVDVLDAVSLARKLTRTELVNEILGAWAADRRAEAEAIVRLTRTA